MSYTEEIRTEELLNNLYYVYTHDISVEEYNGLSIEIKAAVVLKDIAAVYYIKSFTMFLKLYIDNYVKLVELASTK